MKRLIIIILVILFLVLYLYFIYINNKIEIHLYQCVDGDTAWFIIDGNREKVRFLGIDAPESVHPNGIVEDYGVEASDYTCSMLKSAKHIYIEYDSNSEIRDKYNRVLGYVFVDDNNLSELLLSKGYAYVDYIYGDYKYLDNLCIAQSIAYHNRLGLWNNNYSEYLDNYCYKNGY